MLGPASAASDICRAKEEETLRTVGVGEEASSDRSGEGEGGTEAEGDIFAIG